MGRPKMPAKQKKAKLNLTVTNETKEKLDLMRSKMDISVSQLFENLIEKEFKKMTKTGLIKDVPGQLNIDDLE